MKRFFAVLLLFAGFGLLLEGALFVFTWLGPLNSKPSSGPRWPLGAIGLCMILAGWTLRRLGLRRWRAATVNREAQP